MAKFLSRLFRRSSSKNSSLNGSQTSIQSSQNRSKTVSNTRTSSSLENLASYHVIPKELEKSKLHKASWEGNLHKVERLARPGQINVKDQQMRTALHLAVVKGHLDIVRHLVQENAKLDVVDNENRTPLIKAVLSGNQNPQLNYQICHVLLEGGADAYMNQVDKQGKNALHYAIDFGNYRLVELFLSNENCDPNVYDHDQMTPLHLAIKKKSPQIVQLLLSDQQVDPNIVNRYGQTPLHLAASVGYIDIVRLLLLSNLHEPCDPTILDFQQLTAYQLAKDKHQEACAKLIEEYQEKRYKIRNLTSTSINEHPSKRLTNSISMNPAANLQRAHDDTSDDSTSMSTSKPSKSSPRRKQRPSDQWSDNNDPSIDTSKPGSHGITSLFQNNPLKSNESKTNGNSALNNLIHTDSKKKGSISQKKQSPSFFGIGPVAERKDSDNTSTSVSIDKSVLPVKSNLQNKPATSNSHVNTALRPVSQTKSWSDDTITAPVPKPPLTKLQSNSWDTSLSDDDTSISKPKNVSSNLQKTQPFAASTNYPTSSDSDDNSVETEIRKFDLEKPSNETTVQNLVNKQIGNGYKVIGLTEVKSPRSEDSSWTTSLVPINNEPPTKGIHNLIQKKDDSTWDDSRPLSADLRSTHNLSTNASKQHTTGVENLTSIMNTIVHSDKTRSTSPKVLGKLIVSSMVNRTDSIPSENTSLEADNFKTKRQLPYDGNSLRDSISSINETQVNELKENIKRLERNQEDSRELKRQLKDMEKKKNDFEKLYKENGQMLRDIENKLQKEKDEKERLELTTKSLNSELKNVKQRLDSLQDEKEVLNQRCIKLKQERDNHDDKLRMIQSSSSQSTITSFHEDDVNKMKSRHREDMKLLSSENENLYHQKKKLESDLQLHKESLDVTVRYKIELEKALEEKTFFQREFDRLKYEKDLIEQEKIVFKTKYDSLQEEIRLLLLDRSKLEQSLTGELQEHIEEKQRSTEDMRKYRTKIEQLNIKLDDADARLHVLQTQNEALLASKDRYIKNEFDSLAQRLNQTESDKLDAEQRYHNQHQEITNKQQQHVANESLAALTSTPLSYGAQAQHKLSSSCAKCNTLQRSYEQERDAISYQKQYQYLNKSFPSNQQENENYLIEYSRQMRSDTERVKSELDHLRHDFDTLVSNYEPTNNFYHQTQLHSQIDTFRQLYEQEYRQRQFLMSNLTPGNKSTIGNNYHKHSFNGTTNSRLLKERLETTIDIALGDSRRKQIPAIPRQASSLLSLNTTHNGAMSSVELLRKRYHI